ncbi:MAG: hypothetical protein ACLFPO_02685 [Spirochaetaceae bacterium]
MSERTADAALDLGEAVRGALDALAQLDNTLETPLRVFRILADRLAIARGALLLPDPESGELAPWSMRGLDRTTEHRLRIPVAELTGRILDVHAAVTILSGNALRACKPYVSQREFDRLERVALVPFGGEDRIYGLLVITSSPHLATSSSVLDVAFSAIARPVRAILLENRETRLQGGGDRAILDEGELQAIAAETPTPERGRVVLVRFDIDGLVERISGGAEDLDRYRIRQDVLRVITVMVSEIVTIGTSAAGKVILIVTSDEALSPTMILRQISLKLAELFDELEAPPDLNVILRRVDHAVERVDEALSELL